MSFGDNLKSAKNEVSQSFSGEKVDNLQQNSNISAKLRFE